MTYVCILRLVGSRVEAGLFFASIKRAAEADLSSADNLSDGTCGPLLKRLWQLSVPVCQLYDRCYSSLNSNTVGSAPLSECPQQQNKVRRTFTLRSEYEFPD